MNTIRVNVVPPYDVIVRPGLLRDVGTVVRSLSNAPSCGLVSDSVVAPLYADRVVSSLVAAGFKVHDVTLPAGEEHKTLATVARIYDAMLSAGIERATPLVALGGGVTGDMTGFAAATLLRGIPFVQVPTSLLAMVDASVGGKTGIDHPVGKNLIGAFHQPLGVLIDTDVLRTLPPRELRSGLAECIKHEIIRDADGFAELERNVGRALAVDTAYLAELVAHNVAIKARVVEADPFEKGERAHLNFGHTFGHAIETLSQYSYSHGESVGLGMVAASHLAADLGLIDGPTLGRIMALIAAVDLPVDGLTLDPSAVLAAMMFDKKVRGGRVRLVLPTRIGAMAIRDDIPAEAMRRAVAQLCP